MMSKSGLVATQLAISLTAGGTFLKVCSMQNRVIAEPFFDCQRGLLKSCIALLGLYVLHVCTLNLLRVIKQTKLNIG